MENLVDIFFNVAVRAVVLAPRGQPSQNLLDAFQRAYHQHEMEKCFSEDKKITPPVATRKKRPCTTGGIIA